MRPALRLLALVGALALAACTTGETTVSGAAAGGATGETAPTGPTAVTAPTGPTVPTGTAGGDGSPVSIDLKDLGIAGVSDAAFFSCDGVFGTWTYIFQADFGGGIVFDVNADVDLSSGSGTLEYGDEFDIEGLGTIGWQDTVDLEIAGTDDAPTIHSTNVTVDLTGAVEGFPIDTFKSFPEDREFPIVPGSDHC